MTFSFKALFPAMAIAIGLTLPAMGQEATTDAAATPTPTYMAIGPADAKVTIIEYASFTCPHCADFHASVFKALKTDYIDTGKIRFEFREVYFDRYGLWAAMTARCGGELRFFGITDILYTTQQEWAGTDDATTVVENLKRIGRTVGMDDAALDTCLNDAGMAEALVAQYQTNATADGVEGTPTLFINGEKHSNMSYADLKAIIDPLLAE
jgi:protein-disulfide isomerase